MEYSNESILSDALSIQSSDSGDVFGNILIDNDINDVTQNILQGRTCNTEIKTELESESDKNSEYSFLSDLKSEPKKLSKCQLKKRQQNKNKDNQNNSTDTSKGLFARLFGGGSSRSRATSNPWTWMWILIIALCTIIFFKNKKNRIRVKMPKFICKLICRK